MRYFLEIAFDGSPYVGWQIQPNGPSVQEKVNQILSIILKQPIYSVGCGRTDSGVHAQSFFVHFDTPLPIADAHAFLLKFNGIAPASLAAYRLIPVSEKDHARFSATSRTYEYIITTRKNPHWDRKALHVYSNPNITLMNKAASLLLGEQNFKAFSRVNDLKHHNCTVMEAYFTANTHDHTLIFTITANRFLRNMVRAITGTLLKIGTQNTDPNTICNIIQSQDRKNAGQSVAAHGLYLTHISYPFITY